MSYKHCSDLAETYVNTILNEGFNNIDNIPFALILFDMMMVERLNGNKINCLANYGYGVLCCTNF